MCIGLLIGKACRVISKFLHKNTIFRVYLQLFEHEMLKFGNWDTNGDEIWGTFINTT